MSNIVNPDARKIDLHAHYLPQAYKKALLNCGENNPDGFPTPAWSPEMHLEAMDHLGITTSMLSLSSPHINFGDKNAAKALARIANEDGAELVRKYPGKFGLFASLPLPDIEHSIAEIQYATDVLNVDGFTLPTNTLGVYLGNSCLDAIFEELNRHKSVVTLHPNKPSRVPEHVVEGLPIPMMEFFFDTTRTVINMILTGTLNRFSDIKFIIPHAGAFLPVLADRIAPALQMMPSSFDERIGTDVVDIYAALQGLYFDLAGACLPRQLANLMPIVGIDHLVYGSDYPYTPDFACMALADALDITEMLTEEQHRLIYCENALRLFPRLTTG
ncbi:amidohydrolase family protein [Paenibacillus durus]|uniref:6-methylsalicylate decarboxylase n=1 Tax=Paenibacillus durus ATCC 35681 TaxID=1333534 RepID=A0A0F7F8Y4_PAEDU|nr:amidohydrolase family protein [Paenibacillus durus]AKG34869.1 amidohydrolase [Paenibacillus durus ATCC 35681]